MAVRPVFTSAIVVGALTLAGASLAQAPAGGAARESTPEVLPSPEAPAAPATEPAQKRPSSATAGYAYADKPTATSKGPSRSTYRQRGPVVSMPGFELSAEGGSRLFVHLTQNVPVEERKARGSITYVLKGASPRVRNNTNALVTVHFNTPVASARLVPHGRDLHFVVDLRAAATPSWKITESPDKAATLSIDFPKGDFVVGGGESPAEASAPAAADATATEAKKGVPSKPAAPATPAAKKEPSPADGPTP